MDGGTLDSSPNENHGIPTGVSAYTDRNGIESGALWFDGSNDYITVPFSESIDIQAEFSSAVWVYLQGGGCNPRVYEIHEYLNCGGYTLAFNEAPGDLPRTFHTSNFGGCQSSLVAHSGGSASVQPGEWHHVALTFTPGPTSSGKLYVDGILVNEAFLSQDISGINYYGAPLYIGNIAPDRCDWYGGGMDELGFWEKTLSPEEIWSVYVGAPLNPGCTDSTACNFDAEATSDDGSCIPSGCMDSEACNYNALAECEGEACDYSCCPGPGCCAAGTSWDYSLEQCVPIESACSDDLDGDGVIGVNDLMQLLSSFGTDCAPTEEPETTEFTCGDPVNYHGYDYATVQIGEQCWFAENLRSEHYANGDVIPGELSNSEWQNTMEGAQAIYSNDASNLADYGRLYNWYAVDDARGLCPTGWHVPTDGEFMTLEMGLGMSESEANGTGWRGTDQGAEMKSSPEDSPSWDGTNTSGFSGLASGLRNPNGQYGFMNISGLFWTQSLSSLTVAISRALDTGNSAINKDADVKNRGFSIRCIKD